MFFNVLFTNMLANNVLQALKHFSQFLGEHLWEKNFIVMWLCFCYDEQIYKSMYVYMYMWIKKKQLY